MMTLTLTPTALKRCGEERRGERCTQFGVWIQVPLPEELDQRPDAIVPPLRAEPLDLFGGGQPQMDGSRKQTVFRVSNKIKNHTKVIVI